MDIINLLIFLIPSYIANSSPVILGGGIPLDLMKNFSNQRILGDGKTVRGFIGGTLAGTVAGGIVAIYYSLPYFFDAKTQFLAGFIMSFGTLVGDALGSFIKRRFNVESGKPFFLDAIMFLLVALLFAYPVVSEGIYTPLDLAFMIGLTLLVHPLSNIIANKAGLKKVPW